MRFLDSHTRVEGIGDKYPEFPLLLHGPLERLLDVEALAHDSGVQLALEGQQVHVGLRLRHQVAHLLRQDLVRQPLLALGGRPACARARAVRVPATRSLALGSTRYDMHASSTRTGTHGLYRPGLCCGGIAARASGTRLAGGAGADGAAAGRMPGGAATAPPAGPPP